MRWLQHYQQYNACDAARVVSSVGCVGDVFDNIRKAFGGDGARVWEYARCMLKAGVLQMLQHLSRPLLLRFPRLRPDAAVRHTGTGHPTHWSRPLVCSQPRPLALCAFYMVGYQWQTNYTAICSEDDCVVFTHGSSPATRIESPLFKERLGNQLHEYSNGENITWLGFIALQQVCGVLKPTYAKRDIVQ